MKKTFIARHQSRIITKGFTLIEVLLALTILSIILAVLYSTFHLSYRAMNGIDESLLKLKECRMALDIMRRETDSLVYKPENKNSVFKIEGRDIYGKDASRFVFTAFSPLQPGLSHISYYVEEKEGKLVIFKKIRTAHQSDSEGTNKAVEVLEDVAAFYVEAKINDKWEKTWDASESKKIPEELRIMVTVSIKNRPVIMYESVRPKIGRTV